VLDELVKLLSDIEMDPGEAASSEIVVSASRRIALVYADLLVNGVAEAEVARAMLLATLTLYDALGHAAAIPMLLRLTADRYEQQLARLN
jgi:hypothetical protein